MERLIRWLVDRYMPNHHLKLRPKRSSKPRAPRVKKEKKVEQELPLSS